MLVDLFLGGMLGLYLMSKVIGIFKVLLIILIYYFIC